MTGLAFAAPAPPEMTGFSAETPPRVFDADSLYERINGDSFTYLGFGWYESAARVAQLAEGE